MPYPINPDVLIWARERAGLTVGALAFALKVGAEVVAAWEAGLDRPSYAMLERLAYSVLKLPLAVFYFPEPPAIEDPITKFRRLPDYELERLSPDTHYKLRILQGYQESLRTLPTVEASARRIFVDIRPSIGDNVEQLANGIRDIIGLGIDTHLQFRSAENALKAWRHALEVTGIFTFKDTLKDRFISGFCLLDPDFPVIMLNNSSSFTRQLFTLNHELSHILFQVHGVTDVSEEYLEYLDADERKLEIACNRLAAELLVPKKRFASDLWAFERRGLPAVPDIAEKYSVSREVILRRLLDAGKVSADDYQTIVSKWNADYLRDQGKPPGGNYYLTKLAYLGEGFAKATIEAYRRRLIEPIEAAVHLNMNSKNLGNMEKYLRW